MTAEQLLQYFPYFTEVYSEKGEQINPLPENVKLTAYCDNGKGYVRFLEDLTTKEMGIDIFIVKKFIEHSQLQKIVKLQDLLLEVMDLGIMCRQHQLQGYTTKSGKETLKEWMEKNTDKINTIL